MSASRPIDPPTTPIAEYKHAAWRKSAKLPYGLRYGAPAAIFDQVYPQLVQKHGEAMQVWITYPSRT